MEDALLHEDGRVAYHQVDEVVLAVSRENRACDVVHVFLTHVGVVTGALHDVYVYAEALLDIAEAVKKSAYEIIEKTGEFVINLTNEKLAKACDYCGVVSGRDVDKFKKTGLTPVPVEHVKAPAIAESPVNIACRVVESHPLGSHTMFVAEVLGVTVDDAYLDETGKFDINGTGLIMYSHGEYFALGKKLGKFGYSVQKKKK